MHLILTPEIYWYEDLTDYALPISSRDPSTLREAIGGYKKDIWMSVMVEDMESLKKSQTWEFVQLPKGKRVFGCKWDFKRNPTLTIKKEGEGSKFVLYIRSTHIRKGLSMMRFFLQMLDILLSGSY